MRRINEEDFQMFLRTDFVIFVQNSFRELNPETAVCGM